MRRNNVETINYVDAPGLIEEQGVEHAGQAAYGAGNEVQRMDSAGVMNPGNMLMS